MMIHIESESLEILKGAIERLMMSAKGESLYGYCIFQKFALSSHIDFTLGLIDRLNVPGACVVELVGQTVMVCDEMVVQFSDVYLHLFLEPEPGHEVSLHPHENARYYDFQYLPSQ